MAMSLARFARASPTRRRKSALRAFQSDRSESGEKKRFGALQAGVERGVDGLLDRAIRRVVPVADREQRGEPTPS